MPESMPKRVPRRWWIIGLVLVVLAMTAALGAWAWHWADNLPAVVNGTSAVHTAYADLYQAAWRQDEGQGSATMTATLFTPRLIELITADNQRSAIDNQIAPLMESTSDTDVQLVITMAALANSETAKTADAAVGQAFALTAPGYKFSLASLTPLIAPSKASTNSSAAVTNRLWVAKFHSTAAVDWNMIHDLQLKISGLGEIASRDYVWAQPMMLNN